MSDSVWPRRRQPTRLPVPGILQARRLEWVAISFSNAWKWKVKVKLLSCVQPSVTPWTAAFQAPPSMRFSRQEYRSGVPLPSGIMSPIKASRVCLCPIQWKMSFMLCNSMIYQEKLIREKIAYYAKKSTLNWHNSKTVQGYCCLCQLRLDYSQLHILIGNENPIIWSVN